MTFDNQNYFDKNKLEIKKSYDLLSFKIQAQKRLVKIRKTERNYLNDNPPNVYYNLT